LRFGARSARIGRLGRSVEQAHPGEPPVLSLVGPGGNASIAPLRLATVLVQGVCALLIVALLETRKAESA